MTGFEEGRLVGAYRVLRCIGQGGMGTVYEVEHVELGVRYALKTFTLPEDAAHAEVLRQKFFEEGKVLARLKGPHLVHVFDLAIDERTGVPYFVMDLVTYEDGQSYSLADLMEVEFDEELAFDWFKDACETLDYVHEQGIVHRDIKPSNLMLDAEQHVVLADFGVSKIFGTVLHTDIMRGQTRVGDSERESLVMGTEGFMAPEVESGEEATPAADRFSLGMTFLVLLNGGARYDSVSAALGHLAKTPHKFRWSAVLPKLLTPTPERRPAKPFWFSRTPLTVDQWREFGPNDYDECREIEKALGGTYPLTLSLTRKSVDDYCAYLTRKYRRQLPKGYVFRLPSEAEWEFAADSDATVRRYNKPGVRGWGDFVGVAGETARSNFKELSLTRKLGALCGWEDHGWVRGKSFGVGSLALPNTRGICDIYGWDRPVLDVVKRGGRVEYADEETDPLQFSEGVYDERRTHLLARSWECDRRIHGRGYGARFLTHIVLGPDLIGERAWKNPKVVYEIQTKVPQQAKKFDPRKIKGKISKPQEIRLKRVGGLETVFCEIPKGRFNMSNVEGQSKLNHRVDLTYPFWMSKFLVSTKEWREYAPNDFHDSSTVAAERNFSPKHPICLRATQARWRAYCAFLNERYGSVLPAGYVFRLPTEAEWEWAFIADDKNNIRNMRGDLFNNCSEKFRQKFDDEYRQKRWPTNIDYDSCGRIGNVYVGGRTSSTGFGVMDIVAGGWFDIMTLDNYDVMWRDGDNRHDWANAVACMEYADKEENPLHSDGCRSSYVVVRNMGAGRRLLHQGHNASAHIVIAPDLEAPLLADEKKPYPAEDFGGMWLGDKAKRVGQSSHHEGWRNTDERIKRMLSLEPRAEMEGRVDDARGFHTEHEDKPWIMIELDKRRQITGLVIESWGWSTKPLRVWVSDDGKTVKQTPIAKDDVGHKRYRFDFQHRNSTTKYLVIGREPGAVKDWFYLDKVVIYGK